MKEAKLRIAEPEDAAGLLDIYKPYVLHTAITFEYEVPSLQEFEQRIRQFSAQYPYLVCEADRGTPRLCLRPSVPGARRLWMERGMFGVRQPTGGGPSYRPGALQLSDPAAAAAERRESLRRRHPSQQQKRTAS